MAEGTANAGSTGAEGAQAQGTGNEGAEFTPITTQEEFDKVTAGIRYAEKAKYSKYSDYDDLKAKAEELDAIKAASQTDLQKAEERAKKAENDLKIYKDREKLEAWKLEVAQATGIKASLLAGTTKEEIEQHAKAIKEAYEPAAPVVGSEGRKPSAPGKTGKDAFAEAISKLG